MGYMIISNKHQYLALYIVLTKLFLMFKS